jgi:hypothetical protein
MENGDCDRLVLYLGRLGTYECMQNLEGDYAEILVLPFILSFYVNSRFSCPLFA